MRSIIKRSKSAKPQMLAHWLRQRLPRPGRIGLGIAVALVLTAAGAYYFYGNGPLSAKTASKYTYDSSITPESESVWQDKTALYSYTKKFGPKATVLHLNELSARLGDCHTNAHEAGRFAYDIFGDEAFKDGSAECHSGLYHGATEAYFKDKGTANLSENLQTLCSYGTNGFFNHQCFHGIGHGLMAWTNYELPEALKSCDLLDRLRDSCYTGVFMENIVGGLAAETPTEQQAALGGHFTRYLNDDPQYPCNAVDEKYRSSCYFLQTSRMSQLFGGDFAKIAVACSAAPASYHASCFGSMGRDVGAVYRNNPAGAIAACGSPVPIGQLRIDCLNGAVQDWFWDPGGQDAALGFCRALEAGAAKSSCYQTLSVRAADILSTPAERASFCTKAETPYQDKCRELAKT